MTDLFGNNQMSLFGEADGLMPHPQNDAVSIDPAQIRERLHGILEAARAAPQTPWPEKKARVWKIVFPNMANWLPEEEANQLRFEFAQELERLNIAA
jgi:hypothetical protein